MLNRCDNGRCQFDGTLSRVWFALTSNWFISYLQCRLCTICAGIDQFSGLGSFDGKFDLGCFPKQGEGVVAYVIDTGCRASHEDLAGRVILRKTSAYESGADDNGHGTHVAG